MSGTCASCAHGMGAHLNAWPRPAACTAQIRDQEGNRRPCPCPDYRPLRARHASRRRSPAVRLLRWLWGARA
jgi:hypothetical protein